MTLLKYVCDRDVFIPDCLLSIFLASPSTPSNHLGGNIYVSSEGQSRAISCLQTCVGLLSMWFIPSTPVLLNLANSLGFSEDHRIVNH